MLTTRDNRGDISKAAWFDKMLDYMDSFQLDVPEVRMFTVIQRQFTGGGHFYELHLSRNMQLHKSLSYVTWNRSTGMTSYSDMTIDESRELLGARQSIRLAGDSRLTQAFNLGRCRTVAW